MAKQNSDGGIILSALEEDLLTVIRCHPSGTYGLEILDKVNEANKKVGRRKIRVGSLYPALKRMEQQGLIKGQWGEDDEPTGGARRRYYSITAIGDKALYNTWFYRQELGAAYSLG
ncbi:MAG: PadR family transcriptional regulator [Cyanobacteria bacterium P01_H01_bin.21]